MDPICRGSNSSGPERRRLFPESKETSRRPSSLREEGPVAGHPGGSLPTPFLLKAFSPTQLLSATAGPYVAVWGALAWPTATLQAGPQLNLDPPPRAPGRPLPHPLPPAVPSGRQGSTHSSHCHFGSVRLGEPAVSPIAASL